MNFINGEGLLVYYVELSIESHYAEYLTQDLAVIYNDRIHGVVLRLKSDVVFFLVIGLNGG